MEKKLVLILTNGLYGLSMNEAFSRGLQMPGCNVCVTSHYRKITPAFIMQTKPDVVVIDRDCFPAQERTLADGVAWQVQQYRDSWNKPVLAIMLGNEVEINQGLAGIFNDYPDTATLCKDKDFINCGFYIGHWLKKEPLPYKEWCEIVGLVNYSRGEDDLVLIQAIMAMEIGNYKSLPGSFYLRPDEFILFRTSYIFERLDPAVREGMQRMYGLSIPAGGQTKEILR